MITLASLLGMDVLGFFNLQRRPQETVVHKHKIMYCTMLVRVLRTIGYIKKILLAKPAAPASNLEQPSRSELKNTMNKMKCYEKNFKRKSLILSSQNLTITVTFSHFRPQLFHLTMRRLFSTVYRFLLTAAAISAVALSILAATSCEFLDFVHPYESSGRSMVHIERGRHLQSDTSVEDITAPADATNDTTTPTMVGLVNTDYLAQLADSISQAGNLTDGAPDLAAAQAAAQEEAAGILAAAINGTGDESVTTDTDGSVGDQSLQDMFKNSTDELGAVGDEDAVQDFDDTGDASIATQSTDDIVSEEDDSIEPSGRDPSIVSEAESGGIATTFNKTDADASLTDDFLDKIPANAYGVNASDIPSVALSGSAGLFCSANDVSIFDIWKGTFLDSEIAIDEESAHDESEDMARNGAVVSITFGILVTFILVIETLIGWKMCCEKWIVGLLALCACVSQGVTFLFFNSERYW